MGDWCLLDVTEGILKTNIRLLEKNYRYPVSNSLNIKYFKCINKIN
jgi:hypothetical protein